MMTLPIYDIIFYIFAGIVMLSASLVVLLNNPVHCALALITSFIGSAVLWLLAYAEFLALVLILVYVGAVMTLFLFVVMMMEHTHKKNAWFKRILLGFVLLALIFSCMQGILPYFAHTIMSNVTPHGNVQALGEVLYTDYAYAFEVAGALLLVAIIASISLVHRSPQACKTQVLSEQLAADPKQRLKKVK